MEPRRNKAKSNRDQFIEFCWYILLSLQILKNKYSIDYGDWNKNLKSSYWVIAGNFRGCQVLLLSLSIGVLNFRMQSYIFAYINWYGLLEKTVKYPDLNLASFYFRDPSNLLNI